MRISLEQAVRTVQDAARNIGKNFIDPDADWAPVTFLIADNEQKIMPMPMSNDHEKELMATVVLPMMIRLMEPWLVCQVVSAWVVEKVPGEEDPPPRPDHLVEDVLGGLMPSQHPDREEKLCLQAVTADQYQFWTAKIIRRENKPPKLGPWKMFSENEKTSFTGRFVEPIREALKEVAS